MAKNTKRPATPVTSLTVEDLPRPKSATHQVQLAEKRVRELLPELFEQKNFVPVRDEPSRTTEQLTQADLFGFMKVMVGLMHVDFQRRLFRTPVLNGGGGFEPAPERPDRPERQDKPEKPEPLPAPPEAPEATEPPQAEDKPPAPEKPEGDKTWYEKVVDIVRDRISSNVTLAEHIANGEITAEDKVKIAEGVVEAMRRETSIRIQVKKNTEVILTKDKDGNVGVGILYNF